MPKAKPKRGKPSPANAPQGLTYVVTGCSGFLGRNLVAKLLKRKDISRVMGFDVVDSPVSDDRFTFRKLDMRDARLAAAVKAGRPDGLYHLAFVVDPFYDEKEMHDVNIRGTAAVLAAARAARVKHLVVFSSTTAYGAHAGNPALLTEDSSLRGNRRFRYAADKVEVDHMTQAFAKENPGIRVNIVRPCVVLGPNVANYIAAQFLLFPIIPDVDGKNLKSQYVHEDDVVALALRLIDKPVPGIFNVVGEGVIDMAEVGRLQGKKVKVVPAFALKALLSFFWTFRVTAQGVPPGILPYYCHPWIASGERAKKLLGFKPRYTSAEAFATLYANRFAVREATERKFKARGKR